MLVLSPIKIPFLLRRDSVGRCSVGRSNCLKLYGPLKSVSVWSSPLLFFEDCSPVGVSEVWVVERRSLRRSEAGLNGLLLLLLLLLVWIRGRQVGPQGWLWKTRIYTFIKSGGKGGIVLKTLHLQAQAWQCYLCMLVVWLRSLSPYKNYYYLTMLYHLQRETDNFHAVNEIYCPMLYI